MRKKGKHVLYFPKFATLFGFMKNFVYMEQLDSKVEQHCFHIEISNGGKVFGLCWCGNMYTHLKMNGKRELTFVTTLSLNARQKIGHSNNSMTSHFCNLLNHWHIFFFMSFLHLCCSENDDKDIQQIGYFCGCHANAWLPVTHRNNIF